MLTINDDMKVIITDGATRREHGWEEGVPYDVATQEELSKEGMEPELVRGRIAVRPIKEHYRTGYKPVILSNHEYKVVE